MNDKLRRWKQEFDLIEIWLPVLGARFLEVVVFPCKLFWALAGFFCLLLRFLLSRFVGAPGTSIAIGVPPPGVLETPLLDVRCVKACEMCCA